MKNKHKRNIATLLVIIAVAFSSVGHISPLISYSRSDVLKKMGDATDYRWNWGIDFYTFGSYNYYYNYNFITPVEVETWLILFYIPIDIRSQNAAENYIFRSFQISHTKEIAIPSFAIALFNCLLVAIGASFTLFYFYYLLMTLKNINKKKSRSSLYVCILSLFLLIFQIFMVYIATSTSTAFEPNSFNYLEYHLGFFYQLISAVIFLIIYFMQFKIDYSEESNLQNNNQIPNISSQ